MVFRVMGLASVNCCLRMTALDMGLPISISGRPQLIDDSLSSENHQVMNPFCAIPHLLAKDQATVAAAAAAAKSLQSCPTLCDPINGSPPGSAIPGILQARTLEWVAISFSNA